MSNHFIEDNNLSLAWARAIEHISLNPDKEVVPLVVSITGFDKYSHYIEDEKIRKKLDKILKDNKMQSIETVANTIFPYSMWNPKAPSSQLFTRYKKIYSKIKKSSKKNSHGIYFQRMIDGGPQANRNQLDFVINAYKKRSSVRRSIHQIAIFNPSLDHSNAAQRGFPCMQHLTFVPNSKNKTLAVNAFYANQYMVEKAYGNYVGICRLAEFIAHELGLKLERVTIFSGIAQIEKSLKLVNPVLDTLK